MGKEVTLADLWQLGEELELAAPEGTVTVWVKKITPAEMDDVFKKAKAKRAVSLTMSRDVDGDDYQAAMSDAYDVGEHAALVEWIVADDLVPGGPKVLQVQAELAAADEWSKDDYLAGLQDAWNNGLSSALAEDPEDPEASRVFAEMQRFDDQVKVELAAIADNMRSGWNMDTDEQLRAVIAQRIVRNQADTAFMTEYRRAEVWKGTRLASDHSKPYFASRAAVDDLGAQTIALLQAAFGRLAIGVVEGKGLPVDPASSPSSEPPAEPEMAASSGLETASL